MPEYVTTLMVRQQGLSHEVAYEHAKDARKALERAGYRVELGPTLIAGLVDGVGESQGEWDDDESEGDD